MKKHEQDDAEWHQVLGDKKSWAVEKTRIETLLCLSACRTKKDALSPATQYGFGGTADSIKRSINFISSSDFSPRVRHTDNFDIDLHEKCLI
ncbi:hypothetical protein PRIPAC_91108 [Pristionchus pacificus]|uniref:Uncharacterized protein n=1 Tax=Pristionchus pacificus TaxID=54126 RepID=A0A2A6B845_PRIPA|nr:hypothetical protein PRIPAC_91108 [Pristionchus pacificus]|eukprot:PDM62060.1 hypothetical protein PRIPAC_51502 [Pristionchus pacificus]